MGCVLSAQLRRFEAHQDELQARDEAIEARAEWLLLKGNEFYPFDSNNFWEAVFAEAIDDFNQKTDLMNPEELGKEMRRCVEKYWRNKAFEFAENE